MKNKAHAICYHVESFKYLSETKDRHRPVAVVVLLGPTTTKTIDCSPFRPPGKSKKSVAIFSNELMCCDLNDLFLPGHDGGHLLADMLGGSNHPVNRVPMGLDKNRGGSWVSLESSASKCKHGVYAIRCTYNDKDDPRIPIRVEGRLAETDADGLETMLDKVQKNNQWLIDLTKTVAQYGPKPVLPEYTTTGLLKAELYQAVDGGFDQSPMHVVAPTERFNTDLSKLTNLYLSLNMPANWAIENDNAFHLFDINTTPPTGWVYRHEYNLPPLTDRPNAWLDYLALQGQLNDVVFDSVTKKNVQINAAMINHKYKSRSVPGAYRNLIMTWNQFRYQYALSDQKAYYSEAPDDSSSLGKRMTLSPEIDHIIPFTLDGPTLFSNLRLTSNEYNNQRSNSLDPSLAANCVEVGPQVIPPRKRGAAPIPNASIKVPKVGT